MVLEEIFDPSEEVKRGVILATVTRVHDDSSKVTLVPRGSHGLGPQELENGHAKAESTQPPRLCKASRCIQFVDYLRFHVFTVYRQLWILVVAANLAAMIVTVVRQSRKSSPSLAGCINASVANLLMAILIRQDYVKNLMYRTCWSIPHSAPLWLRRRLALVYENGGVHSGAAVSALCWFAVFTAFLWVRFRHDTFSDIAVLVFDCMLAVLLLSIVGTAMPQVRRRYHNMFESVHRWAGWFAIVLFWVALALFARDEARSLDPPASTGGRLVRLPAFWMLVIISLNLIYPWLLLRKVAVIRSERLTLHAIRIFFDRKEKVPELHGLAISSHPLAEWHAFASIPPFSDSDAGAYSCIISNAGDWTGNVVANPAPHYWMRGVHQTGQLAMASVFRRVVIMATGSGIGPCLAAFGHLPHTQMHIIWTAPSPRKIFGDAIYEAVLSQDPQATIWDTRKDGRRPDMVKMAEELYRRTEAEAVFFISNRNLTRVTIAALRKRNVAAYAPVFDS
ncbi:hypothetical protein LTR56_005336 [Elasticomyces elasticus]|nr:hypothetical protein LTR56_005336 [Elasticomyces elasticus]KAK3663228.1 hypothetical protein LTR22_005886 [Elasticomyces elasticus]KAK4929115.1 hypothetical protein LTR49_004312 [Elasticomyces elasticus]KAK5725452.1 hypothetical protein LTR15_003638 [Elasticomyces elasticus]KAK5766494.1 hypothetical protein LTS12_003411 [Elasticomyces elasticus]